MSCVDKGFTIFNASLPNQFGITKSDLRLNFLGTDNRFDFAVKILSDTLASELKDKDFRLNRVACLVGDVGDWAPVECNGTVLLVNIASVANRMGITKNAAVSYLAERSLLMPRSSVYNNYAIHIYNEIRNQRMNIDEGRLLLALKEKFGSESDNVYNSLVHGKGFRLNATINRILLTHKFVLKRQLKEIDFFKFICDPATNFIERYSSDNCLEKLYNFFYKNHIDFNSNLAKTIFAATGWRSVDKVIANYEFCVDRGFSKDQTEIYMYWFNESQLTTANLLTSIYTYAQSINLDFKKFNPKLVAYIMVAMQCCQLKENYCLRRFWLSFC